MKVKELCRLVEKMKAVDLDEYEVTYDGGVMCLGYYEYNPEVAGFYIDEESKTVVFDGELK